MKFIVEGRNIPYHFIERDRIPKVEEILVLDGENNTTYDVEVTRYTSAAKGNTMGVEGKITVELL